MNKDKLLASPFFIVSLCAGCSLSGDTALDSPATITQASSPANVVIRNKTTDFGDGSGVAGGERAIMPGDLDGDGYDDMVVVEALCAHIIYGAGTLPHVLDTANTATLVGSSEMKDSCTNDRSSSPTHPMPVQANWLGLAAAGDVDRDGFADFLVFFDGMNDMYESTATVHLVGAYLVYGGPTRLIGRHLLAEASGAFFANAQSPTGLGDVNGDGFADIGALDADFDMTYTAGTVAVFFGSATRFAGEVALDRADAHLSEPAGYQFQFGLHPAGDLNGDGYADFLVGKANADPPMGCDQLVTRVWIVLGGTGVVGALSLDSMPFIEGKIVTPHSGYAVPLGDLDGDGFDDLAVTTCHNKEQADDPGSDTNILFGRPDLSTLQGPWDVTFPNTPTLVSADVDGDGIRDLIVGNPYANDGNGVVYIRRGTGTRLSGSIDPTLGSLAIPSSYRRTDSCSSCYNEAVGDWLAVGSDVDGDGLAEILVGASWVQVAPNWDPISDPVLGTGHAYLLRGAAIKASLPP